MNKTCDNCKWLVQYNGMCCQPQTSWKLRPESNTCDNWGANPLVQLGIDIERTRCTQACDKLTEEYRQLLRAYNECNHRDRVAAYTAALVALEQVGKLIRGER